MRRRLFMLARQVRRQPFIRPLGGVVCPWPSPRRLFVLRAGKVGEEDQPEASDALPDQRLRALTATERSLDLALR